MVIRDATAPTLSVFVPSGTHDVKGLKTLNTSHLVVRSGHESRTRHNTYYESNHCLFRESYFFPPWLFLPIQGPDLFFSSVIIVHRR
jgi:hypothetical protein